MYAEVVHLDVHTFWQQKMQQVQQKLKPTISSVILQYKRKWPAIAYWDVPFREPR